MIELTYPLNRIPIEKLIVTQLAGAAPFIEAEVLSQNSATGRYLSQMNPADILKLVSLRPTLTRSSLCQQDAQVVCPRQTYHSSLCGSVGPRVLQVAVCVINFTSRPLHSWRKSPQHPLDRRLHEPQGRSGRSGEKISCSCRKSSYGS
jgi:hypothetical protein